MPEHGGVEMADKLRFAYRQFIMKNPNIEKLIAVFFHKFG
jgi:hypothetical protein